MWVATLIFMIGFSALIAGSYSGFFSSLIVAVVVGFLGVPSLILGSIGMVVNRQHKTNKTPKREFVILSRILLALGVISICLLIVGFIANLTH